MKLYTSVGPNPRVVKMFMAEKGLKLDMIEIDLRGGENRRGPFLAVNPAGQTPALELDDGAHLTEITAICEYLEEVDHNPPLVGVNAEERAMTRMWVRRIDLKICEPLANLDALVRPVLRVTPTLSATELRRYLFEANQVNSHGGLMLIRANVPTPVFDMLDAFRKADDVLLNAVQGISDLITIPGLINVDFADVKTIMSNMGRALMGTGRAAGERRAIEAAQQAISSPLLEDVSITGATGMTEPPSTWEQVNDFSRKLKGQKDPLTGLDAYGFLDPQKGWGGFGFYFLGSRATAYAKHPDDKAWLFDIDRSRVVCMAGVALLVVGCGRRAHDHDAQVQRSHVQHHTYIGAREPKKVRYGYALAPLAAAQHQRVVGDGIGLAQQHPCRMTELVQAGAHHLRLAAQAVRVLHAVVALEVAQADPAAGEQLAVVLRHVDLAGLAAQRVDARVERAVAAARGVPQEGDPDPLGADRRHVGLDAAAEVHLDI